MAIAAARFNSAIVDRLVDGAIDGFLRHQVSENAITVAKCPGAWELMVAQALVATVITMPWSALAA